MLTAAKCSYLNERNFGNFINSFPVTVHVINSSNALQNAAKSSCCSFFTERKCFFINLTYSCERNVKSASRRNQRVKFEPKGMFLQMSDAWCIAWLESEIYGRMIHKNTLKLL